jgi:type IV pilus assembly protein PilW
MLRDYQRVNSYIPLKNEKGFSIIELLVAMAISLVVLASVYSVFRSQQKSTVVREQINMMQQNIRAGMTVMTRDIRMAGYVHPVITEPLAAGITVANPNDLTFTLLKDRGSTPDPAVKTLETIKYSLSDKDADGDQDLVREIDGGDPMIIAENIDALDFVYLDENGGVTANLGDIRSVQVTMVARTGKGDQGYKDTNVYKNQQGAELLNNPEDNFRRRMLSREILCRNLF